MDEDEGKLLDGIGRFARQQEAEERRRFDERWRRLAAGTISEADDAALRALAAESEEARLDYEALRPFGPQLQDRLARDWQARTPAALPDEPLPLPIGERRWRRAPPYRWLAVAATLAVAVLGWRLWRGPDLPTMPEYGHELFGAVQEMRSPEPTLDVPVFVPGSPFRLVLRPQQPIEEDLERRYYLVGSTGELRPWRVDLALSAEGVVEIAGTVGEDLLIEPGDWAVVFVYGRPGRLPDPEDLLAAESAEDWGVIRVPFRVAVSSLSSLEPRLEVELAGCQTYYMDRRCVPSDELTLWVRAPGHTGLAVRVGERWLDDPGVAVDGGRRFTIAASARDREIEVRASTPEGEEIWRLELVDRQLPAWLVAGRGHFAAGELAAARDQLADHIVAEPIAAALARSTLARVFMGLGVPEEEVLAHLAQATELHQQTGDLINLARDLGVAIYLDLRHQRFASALERLAKLSSAFPEVVPVEARLVLVHYRVILQRKLGNFRQALEHGQRELTLTRRMGLVDQQAQAEETMALVLQDLGRFAEADQLLRGLETVYEDDPCSLVRLLNNRAWVLIRAADAALGDPLPLHVKALRIAEREGCGATRLLDVVLDQARALVERGKTWEGLQALERARALAEQATPLQRLWWEQIEGLLALQDDRALDALASFEHLEDMSRVSLFSEGQWLAKLGQARAHRLLDDTPATLAALAEAEALLGEHSFQVPLHAGRGRFLAEREAGTRFHLETLLEKNRVAEALAVARRSRARLLRGLHQSHRLAHLSAAEQAAWNHEIEVYLRVRAELEAAAAGDWRLSVEGLEQALEGRNGRREEALRALDRAFRMLDRERSVGEPPLRAGDAVLVYHPLSRGWVSFGAFSDLVESHRFELPDDAFSDPEELAGLLLEPFREILSAAHGVRILPYGRLNELDFHALPWDGDVLLDTHPVVYGLDLTARLAISSSRRALVVADPRGDLPAADAEGDAVAMTLRSSSTVWDVVPLKGATATPARFRELISEVDLLHYAGHGAFAGPGGWDSALLLAGESRFTLGDVLALDRAPAEVVLSSCEAARAVHDGGAANLGLAQAFVVAGSERVIAALRPVGDRVTAGFFRELYGILSPSVDLAEALRRAQLAWRQRDPGADWASFRLLEP